MDARLVWRFRHALQVAIPVAVTADTIYSVIKVHSLAKEQLKEWQEEDDAALCAELAATLRRVGVRCAARDRDFWPAALSPRLGLEAAPMIAATATRVAAEGGANLAGSSAVTAAAEREEAADAQADALWHLLGLLPASDAAHTAGSTAQGQQHCAASVTGAGEQHSQQQPHNDSACASATAAAAGAALRGVQVSYVTLEDAWSHVVTAMLGSHAMVTPKPAVVQVTLGDVWQHLAGTAPARAAAGVRQALRARALAAADAARERGRAALPWPELRLRRKSALRCGVEVAGVSWPAVERPSLELVLTHY